MRLWSARDTRVGLRSRRFRLRFFLVRMWLLLARRRRILPLAVSLRRLAAPLLVFILGMIFSSGSAGPGSEHRLHRPLSPEADRPVLLGLLAHLALRGANTMNITLPSKLGSASTLPTSDRSSLSLSSTSSPSSA